jgi:histidinol-phosphate aminotransferase/threonine-phosphate decarboxylase
MMVFQHKYYSGIRQTETMDPNAVAALASTDGLPERDNGDGCGEGPDSGEVPAGSGRVPHGGSEDPLLLDFSANTNPRTPEGVTQVYEAALSPAHAYPSEDYYEFRAAAADYVGCTAPEVIPTAGGLAAIRLTIATTVTPGDSVLVPTPSFGEYAREVRLQGGDVEFVAHDRILAANPSDHALAIVCNPNNPTGDAYDPERLRAFTQRCRATGTPLLVDEAFVDFTDQPSLAGETGVVVARSLTKMFGLPGLRAGFAVATGEHRTHLDTARLAWGLSSVAATVGAHCVQAEEFVAETRKRVRTERARMADRLGTRFDVAPSEAPFLLLDVGSSETVDDVLSVVREHDIAVRDARTFRGLDQHVRVAVRLPDENDRLLDALDV